jgi:hypothetical protein
VKSWKGSTASFTETADREVSPKWDTGSPLCAVRDTVSYLRLVGSGGCSSPFGDDATISKNKETINKPAIAAPINISTFQRRLYLFRTACHSSKHARFQKSAVFLSAELADASSPLPTDRNPAVTFDVQIPGVTAGASQAEACATTLPNPTVRNVETPVPGLTAGAGVRTPPHTSAGLLAPPVRAGSGLGTDHGQSALADAAQAAITTQPVKIAAWAG